MSNRVHELILKLIKILNVLLMTGTFAAVWMGYYADRTWAPYYEKGNYLIVALFLFLYAVYADVYDALLISIKRISEMIYSQALAAFLADGIMYIICWLLTKHLPTVWPLLLTFMGQILIGTFWSLLSHKWYFKQFPPKRTAIIYGMRKGMEQLISEYGLDVKFQVERIVSASDCIACNQEGLETMESVFLCGVSSHERNVILKYCVQNNISAYIIPRVGDLLMSSAKHMHMFHLPLLQVQRYHPSVEFLIAKRLIDIVFSGAALLILSPIMIITAIIIKVYDGGPVFYRQCRLTKNGKKFSVLKFRSMTVDAEKDGVARLSTGKNDERITPVGKIIRKVRIDEIPQLLNILKGDMSIVGPRPERPEIADQYEKELPEFSLRLQAKAGLTGYAQIYGKYNTTPYDKLQMDLMYIAKPSLWEDLRIMFATIKILFVPDSTDGIAVGHITANWEDDGNYDENENT